MVARVSSPAFVGRTAELAALRASLARVLAGGSECLLLAGEAGIGKTRLVQELLRDSTGLTVLTGGCVEVGADVLPHAPFVEMLTGLAGRDGPGEVRALAGPA